MRIASTQYSANTKSFEIYISGCNGTCEGCCNPELKDFEVGDILNRRITIQIIEKIKAFDNLVDNIWLLGGDPLDQNYLALMNLILDLLETKKKVWLWTRFELKEINSLLYICDYIKTGEYKKELSTEDNIWFGIKLASSNQRIYKKGVDY